ncbi:MAG: HAD-IIIC family phosphatase [Bacteroidota bacterium]
MTFNQLRKNLKKDFEGKKAVRFALVADSATQLLAQAIRGYGYDVGLNISVYQGEYDQMDLEILNPASSLYTDPRDAIWIFHAAHVRWLKYLKCSPAEQGTFATDMLEQLENYLQVISSRSQAQVLANTLGCLPDAIFGNYGAKVSHSWTYQIRKYNLGLMDLAQKYPNLWVVDLAAQQGQYGQEQVFDSTTYVRTSIAMSLDFLPIVAREVVGIIRGFQGKFRKCLILDLDNTCWGGIIGDDGMEGIQVGQLGIGKAFTELQLWAKNLKERGVILAICSKNTDHIAREPFEKHLDMVLRLEDISIFVANWQNKADNIRYIQQVLNIGFDSMVFVDDNPFERNLVREQLPEVVVPEMPEDPALYTSYLRQCNLFETVSYSNEDHKRTEKYQQEAKRVTLKQQFGSIEDYLKSLEMQGEFLPFDGFHVPRIAQLTQRSNQFNLRTQRYTEEDIRAIMTDPNRQGFYIKLADKFGDYGLISVLILEREGNSWFIDTWIMSCRVLKRDVEKFVLEQVVEWAKSTGAEQLIGEYLPTPKNGLVKEHYANLGFSQNSDSKWTMATGDFKSGVHYIKAENILVI